MKSSQKQRFYVITGQWTDVGYLFLFSCCGLFRGSLSDPAPTWGQRSHTEQQQQKNAFRHLRNAPCWTSLKITNQLSAQNPDVKPLIPPFPMSLCFPRAHFSLGQRLCAGTVFPEILLYDIETEERRRETRPGRATSMLFFCVWSMCTVCVGGEVTSTFDRLIKSL